MANNRKKSDGAPRMASGGPALTLDQTESERAPRALATEATSKGRGEHNQETGSGQETRRGERYNTGQGMRGKCNTPGSRRLCGRIWTTPRLSAVPPVPAI